MSSPDLTHPSDPLVPAPAIELETVTTRQVEDTEASRAEQRRRSRESNAEAKPTGNYNLELNKS